MPAPSIDLIRRKLSRERRAWLVTGVAGFIGSNLLETLLKADQTVIGLDNFYTGHKSNLDEVKSAVTDNQWSAFKMLEGDIRDYSVCREACEGVDFVLHQAALGSVPRSLAQPIETNAVNVTGFLNMIVAARLAHVSNFVYASSSAVYGDHPDLPKVEGRIGRPLSPYAATKLSNEIYADVFARNHRFKSIGLRYFNVFGPRQDPNSDYAAVIPTWISSLLANTPVWINGDGQTSRDFCHIDNVVQANVLAAITDGLAGNGEIYNVAVGEETTLNELFDALRSAVAASFPEVEEINAGYREFRAGDVRHSRADISKARSRLGYDPAVDLRSGLLKSMNWYADRCRPQTRQPLPSE